jgi:hypothetical protein
MTSALLPVGIFSLYPVAAAIGGLWLLCRSGQRSGGQLNVLDIGGPVAVCLGADAVSLSTADANDPFLSTVLHTTLCSSGARSLSRAAIAAHSSSTRS